MLRTALLNFSRRRKRFLQLIADVILIALSLWLAMVVRVGLDDAWSVLAAHDWLFWLAPLVSLPVFIRSGMYRAVIRYFGKEALLHIVKTVSIASLLLAVAIYFYSGQQPPLIPRSFVFIYWIFSLVLIGGLRLMMRQYFMGDLMVAVHAFAPFWRYDQGLTRVAIYGAGSAGTQLAAALRMGKDMQPVAFLDDDSAIATRTIAGLKVYKPKHIEEMLRVTGASQVLLALPGVSRVRRREILAMLEAYPVHVRSVPGFMDLAQGRVKVQDLQEVDVADLLGRDPVVPDQALFERCIRDQVVLVTGAGGSIGSELCRQVLTQRPASLVLYEHSEFNLYAITQELEAYINREQLAVYLYPVLGSVRNKKRLLEVFRNWPVDTVYHAAAYKHVPIVEHNTAEGIRNNVMGTLYTAQAAMATGVRNFVLISTDKAVRPTNVMGGTKRLAEMVLQALSHERQVRLFSDSADEVVNNRTRFTMVRFGNVLESSGSVIPLFRQQIRDGGPVTVTDPGVTRYFMTIPEAAQLVIQAGSMGQGGDVFVLDMGEPVRILDMAEKMIRLSGLTVRTRAAPDGDIEIRFTGLRPGEKLYEELLIGDDVAGTEHPMILRATEEFMPWEQLCGVLSRLLLLAERCDCEEIRAVLLETVNGYRPADDIVDWVYLQAARRS